MLAALRNARQRVIRPSDPFLQTRNDRISIINVITVLALVSALLLACLRA